MADQNGNGESGSTAESILKVLMAQLGTISKAETVTGTPILADKTMIIPVSRVSIGFAAAGSDAGGDVGGANSNRRAKVSIGGTGGGISVEPIAFIVIQPDGKPQLLPIKGTINSVARVIDLIPDAIAKIAAMRNGGGEKPAAEITAGSEPVRKRAPERQED